MQTLEQRFTMQYAFPVFFSRNVFQTEDPLLASVISRAGAKCHNVMCFIDSGVAGEHPLLDSRIEAYALAHPDIMRLSGPVITIPGGESCKHDSSVIEMILRCVKKYHLCRHSFIIAIGGGAVLDAVGYAAAIAHRGVRLIRLPTTVLAQNDAGIGVKNGVNSFGRKNFVGTFAPPFGVINDFDFLATLSSRELRAGIAEAFKIALIKDKSFFNTLYSSRFELAAFRSGPMEKLIYRCADLHMSHIGQGGDPFELGSARPLDFGHWSAHKLEEIAEGALNHGEAVAIGMVLDSLYSSALGMISHDELERILTVLADVGLPLHHPSLADLDVTAALAEFQEHLGGEMAITLLTGIGSKKEVNHIDIRLMERCIDDLLLRDSGVEIADNQPGAAVSLYGGSH